MHLRLWVDVSQGVTEIAKELGRRWKVMDADARAPYQATAEVDKKRYAQEMSVYVPEKNWEKDLKKAKKARKDPNAPKKPMSSFMLYYNQARDKIRAEHPDSKMGQLSKIAGQQWHSMTEEQKTPYKEQQQELKDKYVVEVKAYNEGKVLSPQDPGQLAPMAAMAVPTAL